MQREDDIQTAANKHYASRFDEEMEKLIRIAMGDDDDHMVDCPRCHGDMYVPWEEYDGGPAMPDDDGEMPCPACEDSDETLDRDEAMERLQEMPLCFEKLITDHRRKEIQWEILLGTGGPADRVLVTTDFQGRIESAVYQHQDWFTPWTTAENQDATLVENFANIVGYYEPDPEQPYDPYR